MCGAKNHVEFYPYLHQFNCICTSCISSEYCAEFHPFIYTSCSMLHSDSTSAQFVIFMSSVTNLHLSTTQLDFKWFIIHHHGLYYIIPLPIPCSAIGLQSLVAIVIYHMNNAPWVPPSSAVRDPNSAHKLSGTWQLHFIADSSSATKTLSNSLKPCTTHTIIYRPIQQRNKETISFSCIFCTHTHTLAPSHTTMP